MDTRPVLPDSLVRQLEWRYAVKKFDPAKRISHPDWETLESALVLTPSSYGIQPWKFFVIDSPGIREKLSAAAWGQSQPLDASHLVVLAYRKDLPPEHIEHYVDRITEVRGVTRESLEGFRKLLHSSRDSAAAEGRLDLWNSRQVYIALGVLLTSAALLGIDACPMEGFEPAKFDEILSLSEQGYASVCAVALGYRAEDDAYSQVKKVRFPREELVQHI